MKTKVIEELIKSPVKVMRERVYTPHRLARIRETSEVSTETGVEQERYRFDLILGACFVNLPGPDWIEKREHQHRLLIRTVTEHIYSDVRHKLRELYPIISELADREQREDLFMAVEELLEMTVPE